MTLTPAQKVLRRVEFVDLDCWHFPGWRNGNGYGCISVYVGKKAGKSVYKTMLAHRVVYEYAWGPIPPRHDVHHICRNPSCVNPRHLDILEKSVHGALSRLSQRDQFDYGYNEV